MCDGLLLVRRSLDSFVGFLRWILAASDPDRAFESGHLLVEGQGDGAHGAMAGVDQAVGQTGASAGIESSYRFGWHHGHDSRARHPTQVRTRFFLGYAVVVMKSEVGFGQNQICDDYRLGGCMGALNPSARNAGLHGGLSREQAQDHRCVETDAHGRSRFRPRAIDSRMAVMSCVTLAGTGAAPIHDQSTLCGFMIQNVSPLTTHRSRAISSPG